MLKGSRRGRSQETSQRRSIEIGERVGRGEKGTTTKVSR